MEADKIKRMDIKEFREQGYLQEVNRLFFHPLGLALEVVIDDTDGSEKLGGIWDYREDKEGIYYDIENSSEERIEKFKKNEKFITEKFLERLKIRKDSLGFTIEDIPTKKYDSTINKETYRKMVIQNYNDKKTNEEIDFSLFLSIQQELDMVLEIKHDVIIQQHYEYAALFRDREKYLLNKLNKK